MDPRRFGDDIRLLRHRRGWTQARLAAAADVPRWVVVAIEAGRGDRIVPRRLLAVAVALGGRLSVRVLFQGEGLDRLRDHRHAALVDTVLRWLRTDGWLVATEVSFNVYGERGSIDVLAWHPGTGALLVIEVKSVVPDVGGMLMTLDRKVRLARGIARDRFGWEASTISRLLVLPEHRTARRRVDDHASIFETTFPARNVDVRRWVRAPSGALAGLVFLPVDQQADTRRTSRGRRASATRGRDLESA